MHGHNSLHTMSESEKDSSIFASIGKSQMFDGNLKKHASAVTSTSVDTKVCVYNSSLGKFPTTEFVMHPNKFHGSLERNNTLKH